MRSLPEREEKTMTEVLRSETYYITDTDETIGRLIQMSDLAAPHVRDGFRRTDVGLGDKVLEVGCGPIGALLELSDLVGPRGTVVGVDMDESALRRARAILNRSGRENVRLVHANVNADVGDELRRLGPFDAAYCRHFLIHQADPTETLRRMAAHLRAGGHVVAHELLLDAPLPRSEPHVAELEPTLRWLWEVGGKRGSSPDVARSFHSVCQGAGLREVSQRLFCWVDSHDARRSIQIYRGTLEAIRPALLHHAVASEGEIDAALGRLADAEGWEFEALFPGLFVELLAQVPGEAT
jgi:SAM-dependent methyltransferase